MGSVEGVEDDVVEVLEGDGAAEEEEEADQAIGNAKAAPTPTLLGGREEQLNDVQINPQFTLQ